MPPAPRGWRQADQVQIDTPKERQLVRLTGGEQAFGFVIRRDEGVDRIRGSRDSRRHRWLDYRLKRPESGGPFRKLFLYRFLWRLGVHPAQREENQGTEREDA